MQLIVVRDSGLPHGYSIHNPKIHFSDERFAHSRSVLKLPNYCNECKFYISVLARMRHACTNSIPLDQ